MGDGYEKIGNPWTTERWNFNFIRFFFFLQTNSTKEETKTPAEEPMTEEEKAKQKQRPVATKAVPGTPW